ncbi:TPA: helix-turn-helix transcriptional regulator [Aeromonas veronii]|uniref:helix-turn-helix domain-containing protein n=1 Tax=Aeromonas veronii TaxID=654 RepID=UPI00330861B8|nr:helix-turn-helix transcriptional regulator [Aeromonas veronii]HDO1336258.1 helix-turn-helix transcriptional regulator [Aeromonas veronii]HDO1340779.1 helix-turn-helix transcriptional regulator [Aeromonas veronii]HDO1345306.1 helix-turn-helix transcriptional regulator [Aeromonas veronii]HDO1349881.1 helix-turn-helix transcriptional regulator [Aeromonas veronii]
MDMSVNPPAQPLDDFVLFDKQIWSCDNEFQFHSSCQLVIPYQELVIKLGDNRYDVKAHSIVFLSPFVKYTIFTTKSEKKAYGVLSVNLNRFGSDFYSMQHTSNIFQFYEDGFYGLLLDGNEVAQVKFLFEKIQNKFSLKHLIHVLEIIEKLINAGHRRLSLHKTTLPYKDMLLGEKIACYIDNNLDKEITLRTLADILNISTPTLNRFFHRFFHTSFKKYLMDKKMSKSQFLLMFTTSPIKSIAADLNFCTVSHFAIRFKKHVGVTPSDYRKAVKN